MRGKTAGKGPARMGQIKRYRDNLQDEIDGAALYTALSRCERDPTRQDLFVQLAQAENEHADVWRDRLMAAGISAKDQIR